MVASASGGDSVAVSPQDAVISREALLQGARGVDALLPILTDPIDAEVMPEKGLRIHGHRVLMEDDEMTCWLDGEELLYSSDSHFEKAGKVGLWTKADAVTSFDDLVVRSTDEN